MANIERIIDDLNLPKQILDKSESLIKGLFGQSFDEFGGLIADQVRMRRFQNQIKIFTKAQKLLKESNIDPKKVSLKVLAPLIELSSFEEDESLQDKWSSLTVHVLENNSEVVFQQNCISILNKISSEEAKLLDALYDELNKKRVEWVQRKLEFTNLEQQKSLMGTLLKYPLDKALFSIYEVSRSFTYSNDKTEFLITNLIALGVLKWETEVEAEATRNSEEEEIEIDVTVDTNTYFIFTPLGVKFVEVCKKIK